MKSSLIHIIKKELIAITRDRFGMVLTLILPIFFVYFFNKMVSTDMNHIDVMAVVQKPSERTNQFLRPLLENDNFVFKGTTTSTEEGMRKFKQSEIHALIVLGKDFDKQIDDPMSATTKGGGHASVQIITDNSNTIIGNTATYYIQSALNPQRMNNISMNMLYNPGLYSTFQFGIGLYAFALIYISITAGASGMVKEKERHSIDTIIMSPVSTWQMMLGKLLTSLIVNSLIAAILLAVSYYIVGIPIRGSTVLVAFLSLICIVTTLLLGTFISLSSNTEANALSMTITIVCLPILYFSGVFFPLDSMPDWAQFIGNCTYAKWFIEALRKILLQGVEGKYVIKELSFILLSMFVFLLLCVYRLKDEKWLKS